LEYKDDRLRMDRYVFNAWLACMEEEIELVHSFVPVALYLTAVSIFGWQK